MNCIVYHGNERARSLIRDLEWGDGAKGRKGEQKFRFEVLVTTPEILMQDTTELGRIQWQFCAVDEAQRLKNADSKLSRAMRDDFKFAHIVLLTGTPIQNNITELWSLLNFLEPATFPSTEAFDAKFGHLGSSKEVGKLHTVLKPFLLRRMKNDVEKKLPPRQETLIEVNLTMVTSPPQ
jgi:chromodomain-helicase-DNA-binding protein 7